MKLRSSQSGFSVIEIAIVVAVVGLIAFVGYTAYSRFQDNKTTSSQTDEQTGTTSSAAAAPAIESAADLDEAQKVLDAPEQNDDSDTDQLNSELATF